MALPYGWKSIRLQNLCGFERNFSTKISMKFKLIYENFSENVPFLLFFMDNIKNKNLSTWGHVTVVEYKADGVTPKTRSCNYCAWLKFAHVIRVKRRNATHHQSGEAVDLSKTDDVELPDLVDVDDSAPVVVVVVDNDDDQQKPPPPHAPSTPAIPSQPSSKKKKVLTNFVDRAFTPAEQGYGCKGSVLCC